jgi:hypothetical protein
MTPKEAFGVAVRVIGLSILLSTSGFVAWSVVLASRASGWSLVVVTVGTVIVGFWLLGGAAAIVDRAYFDPSGVGQRPTKAGGQPTPDPTPEFTPDLATGRRTLEDYSKQGIQLPGQGRIYLSVETKHQAWLVPRVACLHALGYQFVASGETQRSVMEASIPCVQLNELPGAPATVFSGLTAGSIQLCLLAGRRDSAVAKEGQEQGIPCPTTREGVSNLVNALAALHVPEAD